MGMSEVHQALERITRNLEADSIASAIADAMAHYLRIWDVTAKADVDDY